MIVRDLRAGLQLGSRHSNLQGFKAVTQTEGSKRMLKARSSVISNADVCLRVMPFTVHWHAGLGRSVGAQLLPVTFSK